MNDFKRTNAPGIPARGAQTPSQPIDVGTVGHGVPSASWCQRVEVFPVSQCFPFLVVAVAALLGHAVSAALGLSMNPIGMYSAATTGSGQHLMTGWAYADPNVGWTNQALGHLAAQQWLHGIVPWWNPDTGIGLPLAGEMQPAALFLPFVFLLKVRGGIVWLMSLLQFLAGSASFVLFRLLKFERWVSLTGALLVMFSSVFAFVPGETILNVVPFLPMLLAGIELACCRANPAAAVAVIAVGIGWSLLGGFPETAFLDGLLAAVWAAARVPSKPNLLTYFLVLIGGGLLGLMIGSPAIVAFADFMRSSGVFASHEFGKASLDVRGLATVVMPYIFGPLGSAPVVGFPPRLAEVTQGYAGYLGVAALPFIVAGLMSERLGRLKWALAAWIGLSMAKTFGWHPLIAVLNVIPFMTNIDFFRYSSPTWDMAAVVLVLLGIEEISAGRPSVMWPTAITLSCIGTGAVLAWPWSPVWHWPQAAMPRIVGWFLGSVVYATVVTAVFALIARFAPGRRRGPALAAMLVIDAAVMFIVPQLSAPRPSHVDWPAIAYLRRNVGLGRVYSLGPIAPNYGAYFGIPMIDSNYVPVAANWAAYISNHLFPPAAVFQSSLFWPAYLQAWRRSASRIMIDHLADYRAIGVNYMVTPPGFSFQKKVEVLHHETHPVAYPLLPGRQMTVIEHAPHTFGAGRRVGAVAVDNATYVGTANGQIVFHLCAGGVCGKGTAKLATASDNAPLWATLGRAVPLVAGQSFTLRIVHRGGTRPNAIWLFDKGNVNGTIDATGRTPPTGKTAQVIFGEGPPAGAPTKVYADRTMDIWKLAGAAPFWAAADGTCEIKTQTRTQVTVFCQGAAKLRRASLLMPGWHAWVNDRPVKIHHAGGIMQSIDLAAGLSRVRFDFVPPYTRVAIWAAAAALATVLAMLTTLSKQRWLSGRLRQKKSA